VPAPTPCCITDFMTDGSLIRLCEAAQRLIGSPVMLRNPDGRVIVQSDGDRVYAFQGVDELAISLEGAITMPVTLSVGVIGSISVAIADDHAEDAEARASAQEFVGLLAATVAETCEDQLQLRRRVDELGVLYKLSSMLVGANTVDAVLKAAIESAASMLGADAGAIRIFDSERRVLQLRASVGLSDAYLAAAGSLPTDRVCDCEALVGTVVVIPDIHERTDLLHLDALDAEHICGMASAGLVFRGETLGLLRLYSKEKMSLSPDECDVLQSIAQQIAAAVANARLLQSQSHSRRVDRQLQLASDVQHRMLPSTLPDTPRLDIATRYESCFELGGDFYDVFDHADGIALTLGDVVGKGVAAALLMSSVRSAIRAYAHTVPDVDEVMALTNQSLSRDTLVNEFATVFFGVIEPNTLRLSYSNAGHDPPIVVRVPSHRAPTRADMDELPIGGMVLGVDPSQRYQQGIYDLQPNDVLLVYSDGLPDAMNFDGERFNKRRVRKALLSILELDPSAPAERIANHLLWEMRRFVGLNKQTDDVTILVVRIEPNED